jgi:hypothetical protein
MTRRTRRFPRLAVAIVAVGLVAPTSALGYTGDVGSPDTTDDSTQAQQNSGYVDHRSPDAIDAGIQAQKAEQMQNQLRKLEAQREAPGYVDHRSPDAQDNSFVRSPAPKVSEPTISASSGGFDWGDAGIGAGAALGLLLIGLSVTFTVVHRRNRAATV